MTEPMFRLMEDRDAESVNALMTDYVRELAGLPLDPDKLVQLLRYLRGIVDDRSHFVLLAEVDGELAGFADYRVEPGMQDASVMFGEMVEFYVLPTHRRRKVGRTLALRAFEHLKALGADLIDLGVLRSNSAGNRFWESLGFRDRSIRKRMYL